MLYTFKTVENNLTMLEREWIIYKAPNGIFRDKKYNI